MNYKFSIVVPSYNNLPLLKRAVGSVRMQKNTSWELIVVDDSNTDEIETYMSSFKEGNIRYVHNRPSLGAVRNWNFGLSKADGDYVILLHHDEAFTSEFHLWRIKEAMDEGVDIVIAHTHVYANGTLYKKTTPELCKSLFLHIPSLLFMTNQIGPSASVAFKKDDMSFFDERLHWLVDVEWYYRMLKGKKVIVLGDDYHVQSIHNHDGQITNSMNVDKELDNDIDVLKSIYRNKMSIIILLSINRLIRESTTIRQMMHKLFNSK